VQLTPQQQLMLMQKQSVVTLTPAQQQLVQRQQQLNSNRILIAASSAGGASGTQVPARNIVMVQAARQGVSTASGMKTVVTQSKPQAISAQGADKAKHKAGHAGISR
jgi:7-cyano-7-deazaguanine synthase in queuosine biosynthesis